MDLGLGRILLGWGFRRILRWRSDRFREVSALKDEEAKGISVMATRQVVRAVDEADGIRVRVRVEDFESGIAPYYGPLTTT